MSASSDKYEKDIAATIASIPGIKAERPSVSAEYSDVKITYYNNKPANVWLEVKMNHTDNLSNPRVFYSNGSWQTTYKTPAAKSAVDLLNKSQKTKAFIRDLSKYTGIPENIIKIPTTKSGLNEPGAVPLHIMKAYFSQPGVNRYIMNEVNFDLGTLVTEHYTLGKKEPAYYMQAGDDFYRISDRNPLGLNQNIPLLKGKGDFKMRISTRTEFYEVQAEIKITNMPVSSYSLKPTSVKLNPFLK